MTIPAQQTTGEPLANPWYISGWTSQNENNVVLPTNQFNIQGFPSGAIYVTVTGNYFDPDGNPIPGFLSFWPSSPLTFTSTFNGVVTTTTVQQRRSGQNLWDLPGAYWGSGKIYLHNGNLLVNLLATDNAGVMMVPANFSYHVKEHFFGGQEYDILVPSTSVSPVDIHSLIVPGSTESEELEFSSPYQIAVISTQYLAVDVTATAGGESFNPTSYEVDFAFINGPTQPQNSDWHRGSWVSGNQPYVAQLLIGPANGGLVLPVGSYIIWVRVISNPQVPIFPVGTLIIY